jgi:hypothetical protein
MSITEIQDKILTGEYRVSDHAIKRMIKRSIERYEVVEAIKLSRNIPKINIHQVVSFMVKRKRGGIYMFKLPCHPRLL